MRLPALSWIVLVCLFAGIFVPARLSHAQDNESVYAPPSPPTVNDFVNQGGVNLDIKITYLNDYIYRGIDRSISQDGGNGTNLQADAKVIFNLGRGPHPYIGVFANMFDEDPESRFQEIRPYLGFDWTLRPIIVSAGNNNYIFPHREDNNTSEVFVQITFMDEVFLRRESPLLSPYIYAAYDFDKYDGFYFEAGVKHDFVIENTGLTITLNGLISYVEHFALFEGPEGAVTGFQRYEVGLTARFSLNKLLNIPRRYGEWSANGYLYYTDGIDNRIRTDTNLWGGAGVEFKY